MSIIRSVVSIVRRAALDYALRWRRDTSLDYSLNQSLRWWMDTSSGLFAGLVVSHCAWPRQLVRAMVPRPPRSVGLLLFSRGRRLQEGHDCLDLGDLQQVFCSGDAWCSWSDECSGRCSAMALTDEDSKRNNKQERHEQIHERGNVPTRTHTHTHVVCWRL